jgi:hypothetical protein
MSIPQASFVILFVNLVIKSIDYSQSDKLFWVYVILNLISYTVPMLDLVLFVRFMSTYPCTIYHFTWLIRKKRDTNLLASSYVEM